MRGRSWTAGTRRLALQVGTLGAIVMYYIFLMATRGVNISPGLPHSSATTASSHVSLSSLPDDRASPYDHLDWMPPRKKSELFKDFVFHPETVQWRSGERKVSCGDEEADAANAAGVDMVFRHVSMATHMPVKDPRAAIEHFEKAIAINKCPAASLNLAILLPVGTRDQLADVKKSMQYLDNIPSDHRLHAKALLWRGLLNEQIGKDKDANIFYIKAFEVDSRLSKQYFGISPEACAKRHCLFFQDVRLGNAEGVEIQVKALRKMLLYAEFGKHFSGYSHVTKEEAEAFVAKWHIWIRNLMPPFVLQTIRDCYRQLIGKKILRFNDKQSKRYYHYNAPAIRFLSATFNELVTRLTDLQTKITYTYMGGYPGGSELPPHVDRMQCEWTMSVSIDVNPGEEVCPLGLKLEPNKLSKDRSHGVKQKPKDPSKMAYVYPHPGDALLMRGRAVVHWRDPIPMHMNCTNLFLHFVREDYHGKLD